MTEETNDAPSRPATGASAPPNFEMESDCDSDNFSSYSGTNYFDTLDEDGGDGVYDGGFDGANIDMDVDMSMEEEQEEQKQESSPSPSDTNLKNPPFGGGIFSRNRGISKQNEAEGLSSSSSSPPTVLQHAPAPPSPVVAPVEEEKEEEEEARESSIVVIPNNNDEIIANTNVEENHMDIDQQEAIVNHDATNNGGTAAEAEPTMECRATLSSEEESSSIMKERAHDAPEAQDTTACIPKEFGAVAVYSNLGSTNLDKCPQVNENEQVHNFPLDDSSGGPDPKQPIEMAKAANNQEEDEDQTAQMDVAVETMNVQAEAEPEALVLVKAPTNEPAPVHAQHNNDDQSPHSYSSVNEAPNSTQNDAIMSDDAMEAAVVLPDDSSPREDAHTLQEPPNNEAAMECDASPSIEAGISEAAIGSPNAMHVQTDGKTLLSTTRPKTPTSFEGASEVLKEDNDSAMNHPGRKLNTLSQDQMPPPFTGNKQPVQTHRSTTTVAGTDYGPANTSKKQQSAALVSPKPVGVSGCNSRSLSRVRHTPTAPLVSPHNSTMATKIPEQIRQQSQSTQRVPQNNSNRPNLLRHDNSCNQSDVQSPFRPSTTSKSSTVSAKVQQTTATKKKRATSSAMRSSKGPMPTSSRRPVMTPRDQALHTERDGFVSRESNQSERYLQHPLNSEKMPHSLKATNNQMDRFSPDNATNELMAHKEPVSQQGFSPNNIQGRLMNMGKSQTDVTPLPPPVSSKNTASYASTTLPIVEESFEDMLNRFSSNLQEAVDCSNAFDIDLVELEVELGNFHSVALRYQGEMIDFLEAAEQLQSFANGACQQ